ncbi:MAG: alkaline phytoceramidase [Proteobacteria bacterium]|nr:alkaline phytoceramidase [Pseudomonadota bacterium]
MSARAAWLLAFTVACIVAAVLLPAMPQPLDYHAFADQRPLWGIPHFGNVVSNVAFAVVGVAGLGVALRRATVFQFPVERLAYVVFFAGVLLTAWGSSYYHLAPDNARLVWDRLPMTIAFGGLIAAQVTERVSLRAGLVVLAPAVLVGLASVLFWQATERRGEGNVLPYAIVQGYAMVMLVLLTTLYPSRYTRGSDLYAVFAWYVVAKLCETFDGEILTALGGTVSGHTLKHLAAAMAGYVVARMLARRTLVAR